MRTPIDILVAAIEKRLATRIAAGNGALVQVLSQRYRAHATSTVHIDGALPARHLSAVNTTPPSSAKPAGPEPTLF